MINVRSEINKTENSNKKKMINKTKKITSLGKLIRQINFWQDKRKNERNVSKGQNTKCKCVNIEKSEFFISSFIPSVKAFLKMKLLGGAWLGQSGESDS